MPNMKLIVYAAVPALLIAGAIGTHRYRRDQELAKQRTIKAEATIPVHMNAGMGVGGVPMSPYPPVDATSRASRALVDILALDGL